MNSCPWREIQRLWPHSPFLLERSLLETCLDSPLLSYDQRLWLKMFLRRPSLPAESGLAPVLMVQERKGSSLFAKAFPLLLHWRSGVSHSPWLPDGLKEQAELVLHQLNPQDSWGLWLWREEELETPCEVWHHFHEAQWSSSWGSLFASLWLAMRGACTRPTVLLSAAWKEGLQEVGFLQEKLACAASFGAQLLFLPLRRGTFVEEKFGNLEVRPLQWRETPLECLRPYLQEVLQLLAPEPTAPLEERCRHYGRLVEVSSELANEYYRWSLCRDLAKACVEKGVQGLATEDLKRLSRLITFLSFNPEGAMFIISALLPEEILLIYTKESEGHLQTLQRLLDELDHRPKLELYCYNSERDEKSDEELWQKVRQFVSQYPPESVAWDVTLGPKDVQILVAWSLFTLEKEVTVLYLQHHWDTKQQRFWPGREKIRRIVLPKAKS